MLIFIKPHNEFLSSRIAIPADKIFSIIQDGKTIEITARTGDTEVLDTNNDGAVTVPTTKIYIVTYSNEVAAAREMTCFYYACQKGDNAFLFTDAPESFDVD